MGRALATIHSVAKPPGLPSARGWVRWTMGHEQSRSAWRRHPQAHAIEEAIAPAVDRALGRRPVLSHGDFNAGNVLWSRGNMSGIVDWETAESAPPGADVGACRFDLAVMGGAAAAEDFLQGYGRDDRDLWFWELLTGLKFVSLYREWLPLWRRFGLIDIDGATVRRSIDAAILDALRRAV
jgi:aminoglycoside phosphotransferase (APT) family kinase protein